MVSSSGPWARTGRLHKGLGAPTRVSLPVRPELPGKDTPGARASCTSGRYEPQALELHTYWHPKSPTRSQMSLATTGCVPYSHDFTATISTTLT